MSISTWLVVLLAWLGAVVFICALLTAAKRAAGPDDPPRPVPLAALDSLVWQVRSELAVEQVVIVARDDDARGGAVVVAGAVLLGVAAGRPAHKRAEPRRGSRRERTRRARRGARPPRPRRPRAPGDAAAVALAYPDGAIAVARLDPERPLTPADLALLRAVVSRESARFPHMRRALRAARAHAVAVNPDGVPRSLLRPRAGAAPLRRSGGDGDHLPELRRSSSPARWPT